MENLMRTKNFNLTIKMQLWTSNMASSGCVPLQSVSSLQCCVHVRVCSGAFSRESIGAPPSCLSGSARPGNPGGKGPWTRHHG